MKKKALITGVTGQDGPYLAKLLLEKDYELQKKYGLGGAKDYAKKQAADAVTALYQAQITAEKNKIDALDKNDPNYQQKVDDINDADVILIKYVLV